MIDLVSAPKNKMHDIRKNFQMIFQDPYSSLNPKMKVGDIITEPMVVHNKGE